MEEKKVFKTPIIEVVEINTNEVLTCSIGGRQPGDNEFDFTSIYN